MRHRKDKCLNCLDEIENEAHGWYKGKFYYVHDLPKRFWTEGSLAWDILN